MISTPMMTMAACRTPLKGVFAGALSLLIVAAQGLGATAGAQERVAAAQAAPAAGSEDEIRTFCGNIADAARDQRYLLQKKELTDLQAEIDKRVKVMEDRTAEYQDWLKRRNDFLKKAEAGLVDVYKNMDAESAAKRLQLVDPVIAASIIMKLNPRVASRVMNEMDAQTAAMLTGIIASASDPTTSRNPT